MKYPNTHMSEVRYIFVVVDVIVALSLTNVKKPNKSISLKSLIFYIKLDLLNFCVK